MKKTVFYTSTLLIFAAFFVFNSCSKSNGNGSDDDDSGIYGNWSFLNIEALTEPDNVQIKKILSTHYTNENEFKKQTVTLNEDGTFISKDFLILGEQSGTFTEKEDIILFNFDNESSFSFEYSLLKKELQIIINFSNEFSLNEANQILKNNGVNTEIVVLKKAYRFIK